MGTVTTDIVELRSGAAPAAPAAGRYRIYVPVDGKPRLKDPAGVEYFVTIAASESKAFAYNNPSPAADIGNSNTEIAFDKSLPLSANFFSPGTRLTVRAAGLVADTNNGGQQLTLRIRLKIGAGPTTVTLATLQFNAGDNDNWFCEVEAHVLSNGAPGSRAFAVRTLQGAGPGAVQLTGLRALSSSFDSTQAVTVEVSAQWTNTHIDNKASLLFLQIEGG